MSFLSRFKLFSGQKQPPVPAPNEHKSVPHETSQPLPHDPEREPEEDDSGKEEDTQEEGKPHLSLVIEQESNKSIRVALPDQKTTLKDFLAGIPSHLLRRGLIPVALQCEGKR